jgi:hypothetical protein
MTPSDLGLLILRLVVGLTMAAHGARRDRIGVSDPHGFCETCQGRLRGDGRLLVLDAEVSRATFAERDFNGEPVGGQAHWHIVHDACMNTDERAVATFLHDADADTRKKLTKWSSHFLAKPWFPNTDWWRLVRHAGGHGALVG